MLVQGEVSRLLPQPRQLRDESPLDHADAGIEAFILQHMSARMQGKRVMRTNAGGRSRRGSHAAYTDEHLQDYPKFKMNVKINRREHPDFDDAYISSVGGNGNGNGNENKELTREELEALGLAGESNSDY